MKTKKTKRIQPKRVWAFRLSESMLRDITRIATSKDMRPGEYVRRVLESHLTADNGGQSDAANPNGPDPRD